MIFGGAEIVGITVVGVSSFIANQILHFIERPDLAKTMDISVGVTAVLFVAYKVVTGIKVVSTMFFL